MPDSEAAEPLNILLITTDQQHFTALGSITPAVPTPNLDRLAEEGTRFDRAYAPNPTCSPTRASIITGQYPSTHGCWSIGTKLDENRPTLGGILGEHGYDTALLGKAHFQPLTSTPDQTSLEAPPTLQDLDFWRDFTGPYYGFQHIELARNHADEGWVGQHYALWMQENGLDTWRDHFQAPGGNAAPRRHVWDLPAEHHYTTFVADRTIAALERSAESGRPFFTWASFNDPHPPYLVPEPWASLVDPADVQPGTYTPGEFDFMPPWFAKTQEAEPDFGEWQETPHYNHGFHSHLIDSEKLRKDIAIYYGMVAFVDDAVGRILSSLEEQGLADSTLVVFTSDHGHFLGQHGLIAKGAFHYEDVLRVPMIVWRPGLVPAGVQSDALQSLVDLAPTFLRAAGVPVPLDMQGVDQLPVWSGEQGSVRDHVIAENRHQPTAVHLRTYVNERYKLTVYREREWGELFDLREDPGETHNRFDDPDFADIRAQLMRELVDAELRREVSRYPRIAVA